MAMTVEIKGNKLCIEIDLEKPTPSASGKTLVVASNRQHQDVSPQCIANCTITLQLLMQKGKLAIDDRFRILGEYLNKTQPKKGRGAGDVFVKWALQNNANPARCDRVPIVEHAERVFESFPDDAELVIFDPPDRKFVAVSAAHPEKPPILQAADSKWLDWAPALKKHGVHVEFLCKEDIQRFQKNKAK